MYCHTDLYAKHLLWAWLGQNRLFDCLCLQVFPTLVSAIPPSSALAHFEGQPCSVFHPAFVIISFFYSLKNVFVCAFNLLILCVRVYACIDMHAYVGQKTSSQGYIFSFHYVGPSDWTQVKSDRFGSKHLSHWAILPALLFCFLLGKCVCMRVQECLAWVLGTELVSCAVKAVLVINCTAISWASIFLLDIFAFLKNHVLLRRLLILYSSG